MAKMVSFQLEWPFRAQLFNHFMADQKPRYNIKGIVQMLLEDWQTWGIKHPYRKHLPVLDLLSKEMLPKVKTKLPQAPLNHSNVSYHWIPGSGAELSTSLSASNTSFPQESVESNKAVRWTHFLQTWQILTKLPAALHRTCLPPLSLALSPSFGCIRAP